MIAVLHITWIPEGNSDAQRIPTWWLLLVFKAVLGALSFSKNGRIGRIGAVSPLSLSKKKKIGKLVIVPNKCLTQFPDGPFE